MAERRPGNVPRRVAALAAAGCLGLHVVIVGLTGTSMLATTAPMLTLSGLCAMCAARLWRGLGDRAEQLTMIMSGLFMIVLHRAIQHAHPHTHPYPDPPAVDLLMRAAVVFAGVQALLVLAGIAAEAVRWAVRAR